LIKLRMNSARRSVLALLLTILCVMSPPGRAAGAEAAYDRTIGAARALLDQGKLAEAYLAASAAITLDGNRWEGHALAALVLSAQGNHVEAGKAVDQAIARAPGEKTATLREMRQRFAAAAAGTVEGRRKFQVLMQIAERADKAVFQKDRLGALREFLTRSAEFILDYPDQPNIWVMRAAAALELDYPGSGWLAGQRLNDFALGQSEDETAKKILAQLQHKGWLGATLPQRDWSTWTMAQARAAAEGEDVEAQRAMGIWYSNGESGLPKDETQAAHWFKRAAELGDALAQTSLGWRYERGLGVTRDPAKAFQWYRRAALLGHVAAQFRLGVLYSEGQGVNQDAGESDAWYRKAAARGHLLAKQMLAVRAIEEERYSDAIPVLREGVRAGLAPSMVHLARLHMSGRGVPQDPKTAEDLLLAAAKDEHRWAFDELCRGYMYERLGTRRYRDALPWCRRAAEEGFEDSQFGAGFLLMTGLGGETDYPAALKWLTAGAERGDVRAQLYLGKMYLTGLAGSGNDDEARTWLQKAAVAGSDEAARLLNALKGSN
jgi:TPR repeat protein